MPTLSYVDVEQAALEWLSGLGWQVLHGPDIAQEMPSARTTGKSSSTGGSGTPSTN